MAHTTKGKAMWGELGETFLLILSKRKHLTESIMQKLAKMFVRVPKGQQDCFSTEEIFCFGPRHQDQSVHKVKSFNFITYKLTNPNCGDVKAPEKM